MRRIRLAIFLCIRLTLFICFLTSLLVSAAATAAEPGLNVNGGAASGTPQAYATLTDAGAKWARHFLYWDDIGKSGLSHYDKIVAEEERRGVKTLLVVSGLNGDPPANLQAYADYVGNLAKRYNGKLEAIEIWNEPDEPLFWKGAPQAERYTELLKRSYTAVKARDPRMTVVLGATTGNNYGFLEQVYAAGGKGYFDVAAAHTDTACLIHPPSWYYRDQGRIARFTFLGYRELRATMLANGDDKPVWLTEIGWSTTQRTCDVGTWAGLKAAGVDEATQASYLLEAFHCLAEDPYVQAAMWFNDRDLVADGSMLNSYGLVRADGSRRPAYAAFQDYARFGDRLTGPCGDFTAPAVQPLDPRPSSAISAADPLIIRAASPDPDVVRITFTLKGAPAEIRNFSNEGRPLDPSTPVRLQWQGAKRLPYGTHTIVITAVDAQGNASTSEVTFYKVDPATLPAQTTAFGKLRLLGRGGKRTLTGQVRAKLPFTLPGRVLVEWHVKRGGGWRRVHGGAPQNPSRPFRFTRRLRYTGAWRVRARYVGRRPYRSSASRWLRFTVR